MVLQCFGLQLLSCLMLSTQDYWEVRGWVVTSEGGQGNRESLRALTRAKDLCRAVMYHISVRHLPSFCVALVALSQNLCLTPHTVQQPCCPEPLTDALG